MSYIAVKFATRHFLLCLLLMLICFCKSGTAAPVLRFSNDDGASFANSFDIQAGDSLAIGIYLQQSASDTVLTDEGIVSWGFDLTIASTSQGVVSNPLVNSAFDAENHNVITSNGFEWEFAEDAGAGIKGDAIRLGGFQFNSTTEGVSVVTVEDRLVGSGIGNASWLTSSLRDLDEQVFGAGAAAKIQFSINAVSAVPEPSSFVLLSCVACLAIGRRRLTLARIRFAWGKRFSFY